MTGFSEQEVVKSALREMLNREESIAKKYAQLATQITEPTTQQMLKGMEQGARHHYGTLSQALERFASSAKGGMTSE